MCGGRQTAGPRAAWIGTGLWCLGLEHGRALESLNGEAGGEAGQRELACGRRVRMRG